MILFTKEDLLLALQTELMQHNLKTEFNIEEIVIDSRKSRVGALFIAIKGENNDGHNFLTQVFENGCNVALVDDEASFKKFATANHNLILVKNTFQALYKLAEFSRAKSAAKIIAVTGSAGKTSVKEMLFNAFSSQGKTYATKGNLNNHFGLPLTLANMPHDTQFAILEMGMNHIHEIDPLSKLAKPHLAIITNIAPAHIGNFKNEEEIALAKSEIFSGLDNKGFVLLNHDNKYFSFLEERAKKIIPIQNILSFGKNAESLYLLENIEVINFSLAQISAKLKNGNKISYEISSINKAAIFNSLIVLAALDLFANDIKKGLASLKNLHATKGRGEILSIKISDKNIIIIDDSYNANAASMKMGIDYLLDAKKSLNKKRAIAILGDMFELGNQAAQLHDEVLNHAVLQGVNFIFTAGNEMKKSAEKIAKNNHASFAGLEELSAALKNYLQDGDILLVKGSRGMAMEKVIELLKQ